jgi:hypothetical protein
MPNVGLLLQLKAEPALVPAVTALVEKTALAYGLAKPESLALTLASEELFAYLAATGAPGREIKITCEPGGYFVKLSFSFQAKEFNLQPFNLTAGAAIGSDETGLVIAARLTDRFRFDQKDGMLQLTLRKDKSYPEPADVTVSEAPKPGKFIIRIPDPEELKLFVKAVRSRFPRSSMPASFAYPGKVVDMMQCGEYHALVAVDKVGHIGGGLLWRWEGTKLVVSFGPYLLSPDKGETAVALVEACIGAIARKNAIGMIARHTTSSLPEEYFEFLGTLKDPENTPPFQPVYYRHLEEDLGASVWCHPELNSFLKDFYARLDFAREIRFIGEAGEYEAPNCVIFTELDKQASRATLHPIWWGEDAPDVIARHIDLLSEEGFGQILFEMDNGQAWQCYFTEALLKAGFEPRLVMPYAATGDLIVFQY